MSSILRTGSGLPWWTHGGLVAAAPPVGPQPGDKSGAMLGIDLRKGFTLSGSLITGIADQSGNNRNVVFSSGQEATLVANYLNGQNAMKFGAGSLGIFGTDFLWTSGSPRGVFMMLQNIAEAGTYYHVFVSMNLGVAGQNFTVNSSNDPAYGLNFGIVNSNTLPMISGADITSAAASFIVNWDGVAFATPSSFAAFINNTVQTITSGTGTNGNTSGGNWLNSYGNSPPPQFPATGCYLMQLWLYNSAITSTERATIFKPFVQTTYGITQS